MLFLITHSIQSFHTVDNMSFFDFVLANPGEDWDWSVLSRNPNITWKIVQDNPDKSWDYSQLSYNTFGYYSYKNKERIIQRTKAIKEELMARTWNPETPLGRYLVEQEAELGF